MILIVKIPGEILVYLKKDLRLLWQINTLKIPSLRKY